MDQYNTVTIAGGNGEIPKEYKNIETFEVKSITSATISDILYLLNTTKRHFILKSKNGWQYMTIQFIPPVAHPSISSTDVSASVAHPSISSTDVSASVREQTTPIFMTVEELEATRHRAASPFRPRRKNSPKRGKKVSKKSGKLRKNKRSKKLRN